jgi:hypothetical protein
LGYALADGRAELGAMFFRAGWLCFLLRVNLSHELARTEGALAEPVARNHSALLDHPSRGTQPAVAPGPKALAEPLAPDGARWRWAFSG